MDNKISRTLEKVKQDPDFIDLINTNFTSVRPLFPQKILLNEFKKYLQHRDYQPDPKGLPKARESISEYYLKRGITFAPENIIITASTSESYSLIFKTMTGAGDTILLPRPSYPLFEYLANYEHLNTEYYDLTPSLDWQPDLHGFKDNAKGIVVISPNNPTGSICSQKSLTRLYSQIHRHKQFLIIDEVFSEFKFADQSLPFISAENIDAPVFLLNGISKMFGLPDLKLSWIALPGKLTADKARIIDRLETANDTYLNANYYIQSALPELFKQGAVYQKHINILLNKNISTLAKFIDKNHLISCNLPRGGIHALLEIMIPAEFEEKLVLGLMEKEKVSVHPGFFYDYQGKTAAIVISLLNDQGKFAQALSRLHRFVIEYQLSLKIT